MVKTCVALAWKMLGRGGIKNPSCIVSRASRSRKVIGGQLDVILNPIFEIKQEDLPILRSYRIPVFCIARRLAPKITPLLSPLANKRDLLYRQNSTLDYRVRRSSRY